MSTGNASGFGRVQAEVERALRQRGPMTQDQLAEVLSLDSSEEVHEVTHRLWRHGTIALTTDRRYRLKERDA